MESPHDPLGLLGMIDKYKRKREQERERKLRERDIASRDRNSAALELTSPTPKKPTGIIEFKGKLYYRSYAAAPKLGVEKRTVTNRCAARIKPCHNAIRGIANVWLIPVADVDAWLNSQDAGKVGKAGKT